MNNEKMNSKIKISNNSSFFILIFVILKSRVGVKIWNDEMKNDRYFKILKSRLLK